MAPRKPTRHDEDFVSEDVATSIEVPALTDEELALLDDPDDAEVTVTTETARQLAQGSDAFDTSRRHTDSMLRIQSVKQTAQEVSTGPWHERAFVPRGVVPPAQVLTRLKEIIAVAEMHPGTRAERVRTGIRAEFLPMLRQAVEQAAGDGVDAWLSSILHPPGAPARNGMLMAVVAAMQKVNAARTNAAALEAAKGLMDVSARHLQDPSAEKLSLKVLEKELEGRVDVAALLQLLFATDAELAAQGDHVDKAIDRLRQELRQAVAQPAGMMWNFSRLKTERRVITAELRRRHGG
ncbi:MAG: hypothetical protein RL653_4397 [Pseudomonadota bacterium]|jgi:hypothetical protein